MLVELGGQLGGEGAAGLDDLGGVERIAVRRWPGIEGAATDHQVERVVEVAVRAARSPRLPAGGRFPRGWHVRSRRRRRHNWRFALAQVVGGGEHAEGRTSRAGRAPQRRARRQAVDAVTKDVEDVFLVVIGVEVVAPAAMPACGRA
ncbi:MAG: hypothetical protein KIS84_07870 [Dokdonella sp.]|nr:hypothetical protein [Dokdonella sp.]